MPARARDYQPGERLPGTVYEIVRFVGSGGMGTVYDVEDTTIGKRYVLKTLHPQLGARDDLGRRLLREARTLGLLNHANIVEVITAGVTTDELRLPYYVMERLNGQSLRMVLEKKGQLELYHAYQIGIDLLDALDHAHAQGVIHRDVKPDNIFLHRTLAGLTVTKLIDFGIQALLQSTTRETAGRFLGTLRYAAPEQIRGEPATPHVDIYAAGLVLYEMIAGRGPFDDAAGPQAIGAAHIDKPAPLLSSMVDVPPALDDLVAAALSKDPGVRPSDALSFASSLRDLKRALPGGKGRSSGSPRTPVAPAVARLSPRPPDARTPVNTPPTPAIAFGPEPVSQTRAKAPPPVGRSPVPEAPVAAAAPTAPVDGAFRWPDERYSGPSEQPQVRTLSVGSSRPSRSGLRMMAAIAVATAGLMAAAIVVERDFAARRAAAAIVPPTQPVVVREQGAAATKAPAASAPAAPQPPPAAEVAVTKPPPSPTAPRKKAKPAPSTSPSVKALLSELRTDRPGPGF